MDTEKGQLAQLSPVRLFLKAEQSAFSGTIAMVREAVKRLYVFDRGKAIFALSNQPEEYLGSLLLGHKKITQEQLDQALVFMKEHPGVRLGDILLSRHFLDFTTLKESLCNQFRIRFHRVATWKEGDYSFVPKLPKNTARIDLNETAVEICFRGLVEHYQSNGVIQKLKEDSIAIATGDGGFDMAELRLSGKEMALFRAINGVNTLADLLTHIKMDERIARAMLLGFQDVGIIRIQDVGEKKPTAAAPEGDLTEDICRRWDASKKQNDFELLGLTRKATTEEIKKTYLEFARKFHPDRCAKNLLAEVRKKAEEFFARVTEANANLSNPAKRKEYETALDQEAAGITPDVVKKAIESEFEFQRGLAMLRKGNFAAAVEALSRAVELYDQEAEYWICYGWAYFKSNAKNRKATDLSKARQLIDRGLKLNPNFADAFYYLGMISKAEGDPDKAKKLFMHTLTMKENHIEANSELRLINMRSEKGKSGLGSLFQKTKH